MPLTRLGRIACKQGDYLTARALLEEGLTLRRQVGQKLLIAYSLGSLAEVALCQGDYLRAIVHLRETLLLCREFGLTHGIAQTFEQFARVVVGQAQPARAARLWGAAEALREISGAGIPSGERSTYDRAVATARARLDAAIFAAAWAEGRAMTVEQAIALALADDTKFVC